MVVREGGEGSVTIETRAFSPSADFLAFCSFNQESTRVGEGRGKPERYLLGHVRHARERCSPEDEGWRGRKRRQKPRRRVQPRPLPAGRAEVTGLGEGRGYALGNRCPRAGRCWSEEGPFLAPSAPVDAALGGEGRNDSRRPPIFEGIK